MAQSKPWAKQAFMVCRFVILLAMIVGFPLMHLMLLWLYLIGADAAGFMGLLGLVLVGYVVAGLALARVRNYYPPRDDGLVFDCWLASSYFATAIVFGMWELQFPMNVGSSQNLLFKYEGGEPNVVLQPWLHAGLFVLIGQCLHLFTGSRIEAEKP